MIDGAVDLELSSGRLHVSSEGSIHGEPVVCVPGLSANHLSFALIAAELAQRGRRVLSLDLRGRGLSPATAAGTYGWIRHAQDVLEAADRLGLGDFDLVGHSMGAFVAMQAANIAPARVRRLVLVDAVGAPEPAAVPAILASVQRLGAVYPSTEAYCAAISGRSIVVPWEELWKPHALYELESVPVGVRPRTSAAAVTEDMLYGASHDATALWPGLEMPTLLVRATRPLPPGGGLIVGQAQRSAFVAAVPSAVVVDVDANHYGVVGHPDALRAIAGFLHRGS
jgi:pimeloyl-ACP methyl ester carboxylesterase